MYIWKRVKICKSHLFKSKMAFGILYWLCCHRMCMFSSRGDWTPTSRAASVLNRSRAALAWGTTELFFDISFTPLHIQFAFALLLLQSFRGLLMLIFWFFWKFWAKSRRGLFRRLQRLFDYQDISAFGPSQQTSHLKICLLRCLCKSL